MSDLYRLKLEKFWKRPEIETLGFEKVEAERVWWCEYPEFNDPNCQTGTPDPKPGNTFLPRKHMSCRWVLLVEVPE